MRRKTWYTGYMIGWEWAKTYATGTKTQRRDIRRKLTRMNDSYNFLVEGIQTGWSDLVEQLAPEIRAGRAPRTINPFKFARVLERL